VIEGNEGDRTGVRCPRGDGEVVYNGNYWCENWLPDDQRAAGRVGCDWILREDEDGNPTDAACRRAWAELRVTYRPLVDYLRANPEENLP
jgi:hypothetical protein